MARAAQNQLMIEAAMAGDQQAVVDLLAIVQPDIKRFARAQCRTSSDVDDAVQEALWQLYRRIGVLRAAGALSSWLFTVVRHACLRLAGSAFYKTLTLDNFVDDIEFANVPMTDLRLDVAAAINSLPSHYREIVILRDLQEMTIDEIALALALTREAVKARLHRARTLLREYLMQ